MAVVAVSAFSSASSYLSLTTAKNNLRTEDLLDVSVADPRAKRKPDASVPVGDDAAVTDRSGGDGSKLVSQYIDFIAYLRSQKGGDYSEERKKLEAEVAGESGVTPKDEGKTPRASENATLTQSQSQQVALALVADGNGNVAFAATAHAEAHLALNFDVKSADGSTVHFEGSVDVSVDIAIAGVIQAAQQAEKKCDPIVLDLNRDGKISLTGPENGVLFDIDRDGKSDRTGFVSGGDGFLALDRNGNGIIDDGGELFGDQHGASNGFQELGRFDENNDGTIDKNDSVFDKLLVATSDGAGSISSEKLTTYGIQSLATKYRSVSEIADGGNEIVQEGSYTQKNGKKGLAADVLLRYVTVG